MIPDSRYTGIWLGSTSIFGIGLDESQPRGHQLAPRGALDCSNYQISHKVAWSGHPRGLATNSGLVLRAWLQIGRSQG